MAAVITPAMSTKKREAIFGGRIMGAKAEHALELAKKAQRDADRAEAELWSIRMEPMGAQRSRRQPFPNASTAGSDGLRSSATDARRVRACRSMRSADPEARRSGSWSHR
jgi:hypothetical protein